MPEVLPEAEIEIIRSALVRKKRESQGFWFWFGVVRDSSALVLRPRRMDKEGGKLERASKAVRRSFKKVMGVVPTRTLSGIAIDSDQGLQFRSTTKFNNFERSIREFSKNHGLKKLIGSTLVIVDDPESTETGEVNDEQSAERNLKDAQILEAMYDPWDSRAISEDEAEGILDRKIDEITISLGILGDSDLEDVPSPPWGSLDVIRVGLDRQLGIFEKEIPEVERELHHQRESDPTADSTLLETALDILRRTSSRMTELRERLDLEDLHGSDDIPLPFEVIEELEMIQRGCDDVERIRTIGWLDVLIRQKEQQAITMNQELEVCHARLEAGALDPLGWKRREHQLDTLKTELNTLVSQSPDHLVDERKIEELEERVRQLQEAYDRRPLFPHQRPGFNTRRDELVAARNALHEHIEELRRHQATLRCQVGDGAVEAVQHDDRTRTTDTPLTPLEHSHVDAYRAHAQATAQAMERDAALLSARLAVASAQEKFDRTLLECPSDELRRTVEDERKCQEDLRVRREELQREREHVDLLKTRFDHRWHWDVALGFQRPDGSDLEPEERMSELTHDLSEIRAQTQATFHRRREILEAENTFDRLCVANAAKRNAWLAESGTEESRRAHAELTEKLDAFKEARAALDDARNRKTAASVQLRRIEVRQEILHRLSQARQAADALKPLLDAAPDLSLWTKDVISPAFAEALGERWPSVERHAKDLTRCLAEARHLGASDEEIEQVYVGAGWPERWHPPFMRKQEKNWIIANNMLREEESAKSERARRDTEALEKIVPKYMAPPLAESSAVVPGLLQRFLHGLEAFEHPGVGDPIENLMATEDLALASQKLMDTGFQLVNLLNEAMTKPIPGLSIAFDLRAALQNAIDTADSWQTTLADARIHDEAYITEHRAEGATDHVQTRGRHLAGRKTVEAIAAFIKLGASIAIVAGPGGHIASAVLQTTSTVLSTGRMIGSYFVDRAQADLAREMASRAGGGDPIARQEIFRNSGRYAAALLALLAEERDPIALAIFSNHRVTDAMVAQSTPYVMKKFLLRELGEETLEDETSWLDRAREWMTKLGALLAPQRPRLHIDTLSEEMILDDPSSFADEYIRGVGMPNICFVLRLAQELERAESERQVLTERLGEAPEDHDLLETLNTLHQGRSDLARQLDGYLEKAALIEQEVGTLLRRYSQVIHNHPERDDVQEALTSLTRCLSGHLRLYRHAAALL